VHDQDRRPYRALFAVPDLPKVVASMQYAPVAGQDSQPAVGL